jgi:hypothetical protein
MHSKNLTRARKTIQTHLYTLFVFAGMSSPGIAEDAPRPVDGIMDNSFFVEEAYNQEPGIVQHIFTGLYSVSRFSSTDDERVDFGFTDEWPVFSQTHQLSYSVPYSFVRTQGQWTDGVGDMLLNYRYQALFKEDTLTALAPRFSLVLPTGDEDRGFGYGTIGYQWNLPFSTAIGDRLFAHANAGLTFLPDVGEQPEHDLLHYNLGASLIYCFNSNFHFMLEWVGVWNETVGISNGTEHEFASIISPGVRYAFNFRNGSQLVLGLAVPLGLTSSTSDIGGLLYLSFEHRLFGKDTSD